jgi:hypothetical protein
VQHRGLCFICCCLCFDCMHYHVKLFMSLVDPYLINMFGEHDPQCPSTRKNPAWQRCCYIRNLVVVFRTRKRDSRTVCPRRIGRVSASVQEITTVHQPQQCQHVWRSTDKDGEQRASPRAMGVNLYKHAPATNMFAFEWQFLLFVNLIACNMMANGTPDLRWAKS